MGGLICTGVAVGSVGVTVGGVGVAALVGCGFDLAIGIGVFVGATAGATFGSFRVVAVSTRRAGAVGSGLGVVDARRAGPTGSRLIMADIGLTRTPGTAAGTGSFSALAGVAVTGEVFVGHEHRFSHGWDI